MRSFAAIGFVLSAIVACGGKVAEQDPQPTPTQSSSSYCTTTSIAYAAGFGGVQGGDAICNRELPGSHFYRRSRDAARRFEAATDKWPRGYGELESGSCWNCRDWTATSSGRFDPRRSEVGCVDGYETAAALVPAPADPKLGGWRICEGGDWPLTCCFE